MEDKNFLGVTMEAQSKNVKPFGAKRLKSAMMIVGKSDVRFFSNFLIFLFFKRFHAIKIIFKCLNGCSTAQCEDDCNRKYLEECSYYCPCHTYCPNGCSCPPSNEIGNDYCPEHIPKKTDLK